MPHDLPRLIAVETLADDWGVLKKTTFELRRRDGHWQRQTRETYDRGDGAVILLFDPVSRRVVLTRQFRLPVFVNSPADEDERGWLIEAPAGLLDAAAPEARIRAEIEEETGFRVGAVRKVFEVFMSPGSVTERLHFFTASYAPGDRVAAGGGSVAEGEDIEVLELPLDEALAMIASGAIRDAKTIMLLQHLALAERAAA